MDSANTISPTHLLETAQILPIADLSPDLSDPSTKAVGGVVTITWPYNKVKGTFAFNLAEPDFRLRRKKGQVRIEFRERAAKAVGDCGIGGNDEILLSLGGAAWEAEEVDRRRGLPGADLGWRLVFSQSLILKIKRAESSETDVVIVDERPSDLPSALRNDPADEHTDEHRIPLSLDPVQSTAVLRSPSPAVPLSPIHHTPLTQKPNANTFNDSEFASPAFVKRARMSYGALFEGGFDIFQEDGASEKRAARHTRFGRHSSSWRYASRSPSPEPASAAPEIMGERSSSPIRAAHSAQTALMADEGCQTTEMDLPSPQPKNTAPETRLDEMVSTKTIIEDAPAHESSRSPWHQKTQMSPNNRSSEPTDLNVSVPGYNDVIPPESESSFAQPDQQPDSRYPFASNPWIMGVAPPTFESQQHLPPSFSHETFASPGIVNVIPNNQSNPFIEVQEPIQGGIVYSTEHNPSGIDSPSPGPNEDATPRATHDKALSNYPAAYLEDDRISQHQELVKESPQYAEVAELGSSSWATINHSSKATAAAPTDHLGSRDGSTPEQAFVIEESDAGFESEPEPMAVEDTVDSGRAYALGMYEDADAEDEVDAQYSDDDEPEYDADEMGGDYDTRNYDQPGDDDEGSLDEDLRPHPSEPEFDDGASWDEEERQEFVDEENEGELEGEYEMDEDMPEPGPQPVVRANPMVIDLISSSEDESEDDNEGDGDHTSTNNERSNAHIVSRVTSSHQQTNLEGERRQVHLDDEEFEIISQASISEADDSYEAGQNGPEYASMHDEAESAEEKEEYMDDDREDGSKNKEESESVLEGELELELREVEDRQKDASSENEGKQPTDLEPESEHEVHSEGDVESGDTQRQIVSPHQTVAEDVPGESGSVPLSAADGLEILSRTVNEEWDTYSQRPATGFLISHR
ncbi:hypothetical protein NPX13_g10987 [Xylaria arbuscula]|uniref:Telomeric single stranded DNA binding POT1/Cdc13 domain-containing protein n=1 Tax=Xylaria arbuscula TaxID=114810 RepID=A0A9W8TG26_9PEZI|nr:hypothetical protein NPX13_g10987 [Xylaria arbuscula]